MTAKRKFRKQQEKNHGTPAIGRDEESGILVAHQTVTDRSLRDASFADIVKDFLRFREVIERKLAVTR